MLKMLKNAASDCIEAVYAIMVQWIESDFKAMTICLRFMQVIELRGKHVVRRGDIVFRHQHLRTRHGF